MRHLVQSGVCALTRPENQRTEIHTPRKRHIQQEAIFDFDALDALATK